MNRMLSRICLVLVVLLAGCMPSTLIELKQSGVHDSFLIDEPYQETYHDISHMLHRCINEGVGLFFVSWHITENLYPDLKYGEMTLSANNMGDKSIQYHIKVSKLKNKSKIDVFAANSGAWSGYPKRLQKWLHTRGQDCP